MIKDYNRVEFEEIKGYSETNFPEIFKKHSLERIWIAQQNIREEIIKQLGKAITEDDILVGRKLC